MEKNNYIYAVVMRDEGSLVRLASYKDRVLAEHYADRLKIRSGEDIFVQREVARNESHVESES